MRSREGSVYSVRSENVTCAPFQLSRVASAPLDSFTLALSLDWVGLKLTASILRERFAAFVLDGF